jgi:DNA invertase Pin-like site-specific DNA recombinase
MKKCICFARVSTEQQDLTAQLEAVCNAAKCDGYTNDDIITVEGKESAIALKEEERQTLNDIKELISLHPTIESIYFFAVDRLSRRMSVIMSIKEWADENKLNLVFLNPHRMQTLRKNEMGEWIEDELGISIKKEEKKPVLLETCATKELVHGK